MSLLTKEVVEAVASSATEVSELSDLELVIVGGGIGDVVFG